MMAATMSVLVTSGWFWAHVGYEERCEAILNAVTSEDWGTLTTREQLSDVALFRAFESTAEYRQWCNDHVPGWLVYGSD